MILNIIDDFLNFISGTADIVDNIKNAIANFFDLFNTIIDMIPEPFKAILLSFSVILIGIIVYKIVRG